MKQLDGKAVIVTGAGGGIGRATCGVLANAGARLMLSDVNADAGHETLEAVRAQGGTAEFFAADLASEDAIRALVEACETTYGSVDGAFNNAAVEQRNKPLTELTLAEWELALRIDLTAVFLCIKHQIKAMQRGNGGAIVNTSSSLGQVAIPNACEYVTAKHGLVGLTRAASAEVGQQGIRINAVLPGITRTPMIARLSEDPALAGFFDHLRQRHTMGRFGEPDEIGAAVVWLLSDAASFVNGAAIAVDGGYLSI